MSSTSVQSRFAAASCDTPLWFRLDVADWRMTSRLCFRRTFRSNIFISNFYTVENRFAEDIVGFRNTAFCGRQLKGKIPTVIDRTTGKIVEFIQGTFTKIIQTLALSWNGPIYNTPSTQLATNSVLCETVLFTIKATTQTLHCCSGNNRRIFDFSIIIRVPHLCDVKIFQLFRKVFEQEIFSFSVFENR